VVRILTTVGSLSTLAQNATILGTVTDPSGAAVPNVHITDTDLDTNQANTFVTNGVGQYVAPELPIGRYMVKAEATNFQLATQQNISLGVGDRRCIDFQLKVGNAQQTATVEANTVAVQSDTGEQSSHQRPAGDPTVDQWPQHVQAGDADTRGIESSAGFSGSESSRRGRLCKF
jgi:hypothetical protein